MINKFKITWACAIVLAGFVFAHASWAASWSAEIQSQGATDTLSVQIGVDATANQEPPPPDPPSFDTMIKILDINDLTTKYATDVRADGESSYHWILAVDPNGDAGPLAPASSTLSWDPADFGSGTYELREGHEGTGTVLVADMKTDTSYQTVEGGNETYYSILFTPSNNPDPVTNFTATPGNQQVDLSWTNPTSNFNGVVIVAKQGSAAISQSPADGSSYAVDNPVGDGFVVFVSNDTTASATITQLNGTALTNDTEYRFEIYAKDATPNYSTLQSATATPTASGIAAVTDFTATPGNQQVDLSWTNPTSNFNGVVIVAKQGSAAISQSPADGSTYAVDDPVGDGFVVFVSNDTTASATITQLNGTALTNDTEYRFEIYAKDATPNYSTLQSATATPTITITAIQTTTGNNGEVEFSWQNPNPLPADYNGIIIIYNADGSEPTDIPVDGTAYEDGQQMITGGSIVGEVTDGTATTAKITGLNNEQQYHFKIYMKDTQNNYTPVDEGIVETPDSNDNVTPPPPPPPQNHGSLRFDTAEYEFDESAGEITITVTRFNGSSGRVSVEYAVSGKSAMENSDYEPAKGTLEFESGQASRTFTIDLIDDTEDEGDETVNLTLSDPSGGAILGSPHTTILTILDDDDPPKLGRLYFPHIASGQGNWETEISLINVDPAESISGTLYAYTQGGTELSQTPLPLAARSRKELTISSELSSPDQIGNLYFEGDREGWVGYTKFFINGKYRVAVPAATEANTGDIYISHIASNAAWWTGISLNNTTAQNKILTIVFDNGETRDLALAPYQNKTFMIKDFFGGKTPQDIGSAIIKNGDGIVGLELFGSQEGSDSHYLSGILLKDDTATELYYPHVASNAQWWTGIVAYNPLPSPCAIKIIPFSQDGTRLSPEITETLDGHARYVYMIRDMNLPPETEWFKIEAPTPITGFELFGTNNGKQLGGYTSVGIAKKDGNFAKIEKEGWTGIAFVNTQDQPASVTLTAYGEFGNVVNTQTLELSPHQKEVRMAEDFFGGDIAGASYIHFVSDTEIVGFQLNGSSDGMMLDGLPAM